MPSPSASREPTNHRVRVVDIKTNGDDLLANIGCPQMERRIDSKEIDRSSFELETSRERPTQEPARKKRRWEIAKLIRASFSEVSVIPLEIAAASCFTLAEFGATDRSRSRGAKFARSEIAPLLAKVADQIKNLVKTLGLRTQCQN